MEQDITNWQNLWKEEQSTAIDINALIQRLNTLEKKGRLERIILLVSFPITLLVLTTLLYFTTSIYYTIAIVMISLGMLMILIQIYRSKFSIVTKNMLNNQKYAETLISKLKERLLTTSRYMWVYCFLLISALNIGYIAILEQMNLSLILRLSIHIFLSCSIFFFMYYSIEKRKQKNNKDIAPLIKFLEDLK